MKSKRIWPWIAAVLLLAVAGALTLTLRHKQIMVQQGNLLKNSAFSLLDSQGMPQDWYTEDYVKTVGFTDYSAGNGAVTIVNHELNDARFAQQVDVQPNALYCLSGEIKAEAEGGRGANLSVADVYSFSESVYDSAGEWTAVRLYGRTGEKQKSITVFARLGGYSGEAVGTASFRNLSLEQVASAPSGVTVENWYRENQKSSSSDTGMASPAWPWLVVIACVYAAVCFAQRRQVFSAAQAQEKKQLNWRVLIGLMLVSLASRLAVAQLIPGYAVDIGCFTYWGSFMAKSGAADFYNTVGFCDYPPGYILVLGLLGHIGNALGTGMTEMLVKLPSILCDAAAVGVLYAFASKRLSGKGALALAALYAFNPLTFATGAAWGQADSVMTFCLLLVVVLAIEQRWAAALPIYMLSVLMKPQALMFGPLGLLALVVVLVRQGNRKLYRQTALGLALAAAIGAAVILPFSPNMDNSEGWWIISLYRSTMGYYDNVTVNACNLYFLFNKNWIDVSMPSAWFIRLAVAALLWGGMAAAALRGAWYRKDRKRQAALAGALLAALAMTAIPMPFSALGTLVIVFSVLLCAGLYIAGGEIRHLPLLGAVLLILLCNLGVMMHERYLFAAVLLLALACVLERDARVYLLFAVVSASVFLNVSLVLDRGIRIGGSAGHLNAPSFGIESDSAALEYVIAAIQCTATFLAGMTAASICADKRYAVMADSGKKAAEVPQGAAPAVAPSRLELEQPMPIAAMRWQDWLIMLGVTAVYAVVALTNLGAVKSPQTWWRSAAADETAVIDLGERHALNMLYLGGIHGRDQEFIVRVSDDGESWSEPYWAQIKEGQCFKWQYLCEVQTYEETRNYSAVPAMLFGRYVRIEAQSIATTLYEVILRDPETQIVYPVASVSAGAEALVDEQDAFFGEPGWYNSTYFDEIYHARTAYEHYLAMRGDYSYYPYETSHPPLGKVLMAFSIGIFGMTPFGWRFAGAMAGVLMLPGLYLLGKMLTKRRITAFAAMFLMAVDCMHFTQTRIATIDSFVVLFILWSMVFMVYYVRMDYWRMKFWQTLVPLFLSGLCMGLAVASKWTGCYAGVGLAVLFFWSLYRRFTQSLEARAHRAEHPDNPRYSNAAAGIYSRPIITLACCLVFFVAVPLIIYYISYIPYFLPYSPSGVTVKRVIRAAVGDYFETGVTGGMLGYHSTPRLGMDHPFYSPWYQWPVIAKPMWYYSGGVKGNTAQTIAAFGNPAVWWGGLAAIAAVALLWLSRHLDREKGLVLHTRQNDMRPAILLIGFAAQYVPWTLVPRGTYIYHYFPSVPFIILCAALCFDLLLDSADQPILVPSWHHRLLAGMGRWFNHDVPEGLQEKANGTVTLRLGKWVTALLILYLVISLGLFIAFFPYASGISASTDWLRAMQWFKGWLYF